MRKIVYVYIMILLVSGCSGIKRTGKSRDEGRTGKSYEISSDEILLNNLNRQNFYIQKANIDFESADFSLSSVATIKFVQPDEYLISVKVLTGMEIARIYLNSDTVMMNDRINRKFYYGKPGVLGARFGIPFEIFPVIFGDFISSDVKKEELKCIDNVINIDTYIKGLKLQYNINCTNRKATSVKPVGYSGVPIQVSFMNFRNEKSVVFPQQISLTHNESGSKLNINIEKIELPWSGELGFVPGERYEKIELK
ncbi:MAG TPA: DUF4292 domain-containing protein [Bacteroidales bacterium]|nr:DUF4292 domain-containing protein [Bacteroidales bacterium]